MKRLAPLLLALLLTACQAEDSLGSVSFVSVARDYSGYSASNQLSTPPNDQEAFSDEFFYLSFSSGNDYSETLFLEKDGVWTVNGSEESWDTSSVLSRLWEPGLDDDDLLIFHYSGHGLEDGSLVVDDDSYLSLDELLQAIGTAGGKKLVILDSCFAGADISGSSALSNGESFSGTKLTGTSVFISATSSFSLLFTGKPDSLDDIWVLAAVTDSQYSYDSWDTGEAGQDSYGAFSYQVLKALGYDFEEGLPGRSSSRITLYSLYRSLMSEISEDLKSVATPQVTLSPVDLVLF